MQNNTNNLYSGNNITCSCTRVGLLKQIYYKMIDKNKSKEQVTLKVMKIQSNEILEVTNKESKTSKVINIRSLIQNLIKKVKRTDIINERERMV